MRLSPLITRLCQPRRERLDAAILIFKCKNDINCILMTCRRLCLCFESRISRGCARGILLSCFDCKEEGNHRYKSNVEIILQNSLFSFPQCFRLNESQLCCQIFLIFNCKFLKNWHFLIYFNLI